MRLLGALLGRPRGRDIPVGLPPWAEENHIHIIAGQEPVAYRLRLKGPDGEVSYRWFRKTSRCNFCGKCCMGLRPDWRQGIKENGECRHLTNPEPGVYTCGAPGMPWGCLKGDGRQRFPDECTVAYEEV